MGSVIDEDSEAMVIVPKSTAKVSKPAKQNKIVEMFQEDDQMIAQAKKLKQQEHHHQI